MDFCTKFYRFNTKPDTPIPWIFHQTLLATPMFLAAATVNESQFPIAPLEAALKRHSRSTWNFWLPFLFNSKVVCLPMMFGVVQCIFVWILRILVAATITWSVFCSSCLWVFDCDHQCYPGKRKRRNPLTEPFCRDYASFWHMKHTNSNETVSLQTPRSPTPKWHTQAISYTCHQNMNENTGYTQRFCFFLL